MRAYLLINRFRRYYVQMLSFNFSHLSKGRFMQIPHFLRSVQRVMSANSPEILTAIGVVGTISTAYFTGRATIRAYQLIQEAEAELERDLETREILDISWREFIPPMVSGVGAVVAIVAANRVQNNRAAVVAAAYTMSEKAFSQYRERVAETMGRQQERDLRDDMTQDLVQRNPVNDREVLITGNGDHLCYDGGSGRYFQSNMETLRKAENDINYQIINQGYASLTDFYELVGLSGTSMSDAVGWNDKIDLRITAVLSNDNRPCLAVEFDFEPKHRFDKFL